MNILVLGGHGTIGKPLVEILLINGHTLWTPEYKKVEGEAYEYMSYGGGVDLTDYRTVDDLFFDCRKIDVVVNLAAKKTNISLNNTNPVDIYADTVQMGLNVFQACREYNIQRLIQCVCSCSYAPAKLLHEENFNNGPPDISIAPHAHAKRQLYYMAQYYEKQYGLKTTTICFNNVYGSFDWQNEINRLHEGQPSQLKVLDALFFRMINAEKIPLKEMEIWGTGKPRREFIYYKDVAHAIFTILRSNENFGLINVGNEKDYTIKETANIIKRTVGYRGRFVFKTDKPDGQMKKLLDSSRFHSIFPYFTFTDLEHGIEQMVGEFK